MCILSPALAAVLGRDILWDVHIGKVENHFPVVEKHTQLFMCQYFELMLIPIFGTC